MIDRATLQQLAQRAALGVRERVVGHQPLSNDPVVQEPVQRSASAGTSSPSPAATPPTLGTLHAGRAADRAKQDEPGQVDDVADEDSTAGAVVLGYLGCGCLNPGDALLGAGVEASLRAAREALPDLRGPP